MPRRRAPTLDERPRQPPRARLRERRVDQLSIEDERSFRHVALYADLKAVLAADRYVFRVLPGALSGRWDRALLLNLTYWGATGGDVLESDRVPADVVAHAAWHHLAARALGMGAANEAGIEGGTAPSAEALFLGESIASAFDIYLVGRFLGHAPRSSFLATQVSAMAQSSRAAGVPERVFQSLLEGVVRDPEGAFGELRQLLYDATLALLPCRGADEALAALVRFDAHRFGPLLHHYELSNWVLYALAYADRSQGGGSRAHAVDAILRSTRDALGWLASSWVSPALDRRSIARAIATAPGALTPTRGDRIRRKTAAAPQATQRPRPARSIRRAR
jgi:hypothetical protein